jgi:bidirectional [NiFe] hydrogenase diaphorase subunit
VVCTGTACYIKGAAKLLHAIEDKFGIRPGETTQDGKLSLVTARCVGSCGLAPVAVFDQKLSGMMTPETLLATVGRMENHDA